METTTITISEDSWKRLNQRKDPGETFEEVISDLLDIDDRLKNTNDTEDP